MHWLIERLDCEPQNSAGPNFVVTAYWRANAIDGNCSATIYGSCGFQIAADAPFTPYESLTEAQVLGWIWSRDVDKAAVEAQLKAQIEAQRNPPIVARTLPWTTAD